MAILLNSSFAISQVLRMLSAVRPVQLAAPASAAPVKAASVAAPSAPASAPPAGVGTTVDIST